MCLYAGECLNNLVMLLLEGSVYLFIFVLFFFVGEGGGGVHQETKLL